MLALILTILKIIGIVLLVILCLIILIIAAVLFVPLRYRITGDYRGSPEKPEMDVSVSWLLGFLKAGVLYGSGGFHYFVKILSFTIFSDEKKPEKKKKRHRRKAKKAAEAETFDDRSRIQEEKQRQEAADKAAEVQQNASVDQPENQNPQDSRDQAEKPGKKPFAPLRRVFEKIRHFPKAVRSFFIRLKEKAAGIRKKISSAGRFLKDPAYLRLAGNLYGKAKKILAFLKPAKADIQITFGSADPGVTGQVTAVAAAAIGFFGWPDVSFTPDFEEETLTAHVFLKGKIRLIHVLIIAVQVLTDKDFRRLVLHKETGSGRSRRKRRKREKARNTQSQNGQKG